MRPRYVLCLAVLVVSSAAWADLRWFDGSTSPGDPPGKLLSDNPGYWGDSILTGVDYTYETPPDNPPDIWREDASRFGRRLLDGHPVGNWWTPAGVNGKPLVAVFDFKRPCRFAEVDVNTRCGAVALTIECADDPAGPWRAAFSRPLADCPAREFHRLPLSDRPAGRYLRLSVEAPGISWVDEVLVWGDADVTTALPEAYNPVVPTPIVTGVAFSSIPGIEKTSFADAQYWEWQRTLTPGERGQAAVWSQVPTWDSVTDKPLLPARTVREVELALAANETECMALALTNTSCEQPAKLRVRLGEFRDRQGKPASVEGSLRVAGAIGSRYYGVNIGPLFEADNLLPAGLMQRYLTNGTAIAGFPEITLSPAGSAVLWLSVTSSGARPGVYSATLSAGAGQVLRVRARVLPVTLPRPRVWLQTWSGTTSQFPFVDAGRPEREVTYKQSLGATVWGGFPEPGSDGELARKLGTAQFQVWGIGDYGHKLYCGQIKPDALTVDDEKAITDIVHGHVARAAELGLTFDDWYVELTDEPGRGNSAAFGALAALVRKADPRVRIYCNPSFWEGNGCLPDEPVYESLSPWYRELIDVSCPIYLLLKDRPRCAPLFAHPRSVNASYDVCTQSAKGETSALVERYRRMAWDAFARGCNGWGFYSYYAPRGNPWTDFDAEWITGEDLPDYQMVYPGPRGPIASRQSEATREGWEDYCLLTLLRRQGRDDVLRSLLRDYQAGTRSLTELRDAALRAAAESAR